MGQNYTPDVALVRMCSSFTGKYGRVFEKRLEPIQFVAILATVYEYAKE